MSKASPRSWCRLIACAHTACLLESGCHPGDWRPAWPSSGLSAFRTRYRVVRCAGPVASGIQRRPVREGRRWVVPFAWQPKGNCVRAQLLVLRFRQAEMCSRKDGPYQRNGFGRNELAA